MRKLGAVLLLFVSAASAKMVGVEMQVIRPQWEDRIGFALSGSVFNQLPIEIGLIENGLFLKPGTGSSDTLHARQSFGYFLGFLFIPQIKIIRPGIEIGIAYDKWVDANQNQDWVVRPFFGAKVQVSVLSFSATSRGFGAGLNLSL